MTALLYNNNASGTIAANSGISPTATQFTMTAGQAGAFPSPSAGQAFYGTFTSQANPALVEIVLVTAVSGNVFSITRGQDGTAGQTWNPGDYFSQNLVAAEIRNFTVQNQSATFSSVSSTGIITPATTYGIAGTTLGDNANAGSIGEYMTTTFSGEGIGNGVFSTMATLNLSSGDWDVSGTITFEPVGSFINVLAGVSTTASVVGPTGSYSQMTLGAGFGNGMQQSLPTPIFRANVSSPTNVYLVAYAATVSGTDFISTYGMFRARRVR